MLDDKYVFSALQVITANATTVNSTSTVDLGALIEEFSLGAGTPVARTKMGPKSGRINLVIRMAVLPTAGTSIAFVLQDSADDSTFADTEISVATIAIADLVPGYEVLNIPLPFGINRYLLIEYETTGDHTGSVGSINAQLEFGSHMR
jgi:hypothetical protein